MEISRVETASEGRSNIDDCSKLARAIEEAVARQGLPPDLARVTRSVFIDIRGEYAVTVTLSGEKHSFRLAGLGDAESVAEGVMRAYEAQIARAERRARSP